MNTIVRPTIKHSALYTASRQAHDNANIASAQAISATRLAFAAYAGHVPHHLIAAMHRPEGVAGAAAEEHVRHAEALDALGAEEQRPAVARLICMAADAHEQAAEAHAAHATAHDAYTVAKAVFQ